MRISVIDKSKSFFLSPKLYLLVRLVIGIIFIYSGFIKLMDPKSFAHTVSQYGLVPEILLAPVAIGLPAVELLAGLGLIFNFRGSLNAIFGMLVLFVFVLWFGILRNLDIDCGCFSQEEIAGHNSLRTALYRDLVMICMVSYLYLYNRTKRIGINHDHGLTKSLEGGMRNVTQS